MYVYACMCVFYGLQKFKKLEYYQGFKAHFLNSTLLIAIKSH